MFDLCGEPYEEVGLPPNMLRMMAGWHTGASYIMSFPAKLLVKIVMITSSMCRHVSQVIQACSTLTHCLHAA
jgi:hypothetical protein